MVQVKRFVFKCHIKYYILSLKDHFCFHRPRPLEEASELYVTDVEVVGYAEKSNIFVSWIST